MTDSNRCADGNGAFRHRWMMDWSSPWEYTAHAVRRQLLHTRSRFQEIEIYESEGYGRCLVLDGEVQSFEADEYIYHEALVHPGMLLHRGPESVLVIGGGEGATLREVLRHRSVHQAMMVELDEEMVAAARRLLPSYHAGAFDDPRTQLHFGDGRAFLEQTGQRFDAIIVDVNNPMQGGPSTKLFTAEFYTTVRQRLNPGGVLAVQADSATLHALPGSSIIQHTLRAVFARAYPCVTFIPSYTNAWCFAIAGDQLTDPLAVAAEEIDRRIDRRLQSALNFYDGITHHRIFRLPKYVREAFKRRRAPNRDANPMQEQYPGFLSAPPDP